MSKKANEDKKKAANTRGLGILLILSLLMVPLVYWLISWQVAFGLLLILPLVAYWLFIPSKFRRLFIYAYAIYFFGFICATVLQIQLAENPKWIRYIDAHAVAAFFLGGQNAFPKQVLFSIVVGALAGYLVVNIPLWSVLFASSEWVLALHQIDNLDRKTAMRHLKSLILDYQYPWVIVDDGKITESKPRGVLPMLGGPGKAVIRPGHAVVFQRHGKISRIAAPGLIHLERFEEIRNIVQLKPMFKSDVLENVLTKDRIPLRITFGVSFQLEPKTEADKRPGSHVSGGVALTPVLSDEIYTVYEGSVRKAVFGTAADWAATTFAVGDSMLRDIVATYYFDQIFKKIDEPDHADGPGRYDPKHRTVHEIEQRILDRHRKAAVTWGVYTKGVDIKIIELPKEAREQMLEWWRAGWQRRVAVTHAEGAKHAAITRGEGEAEALGARELARAEAQTRMIMAIAHGFSHMSPADREALLGLRFLEALEKIADDPATKILLPTSYRFGEFDLATLLPGSGSKPGSDDPQDTKSLPDGKDTTTIDTPEPPSRSDQ
ncbi:MAG: SPFH/Band 7/PHB domain protein [Anaerolineae bacterium]